MPRGAALNQAHWATRPVMDRAAMGECPDELPREDSTCSREAESQTSARYVEPGPPSHCHKRRRHLCSEPVGAPVGATGEPLRRPRVLY